MYEYYNDINLYLQKTWNCFFNICKLNLSDVKALGHILVGSAFFFLSGYKIVKHFLQKFCFRVDEIGPVSLKV